MSYYWYLLGLSKITEIVVLEGLEIKIFFPTQPWWPTFLKALYTIKIALKKSIAPLPTESRICPALLL